jgi:nucleoside-diphosphate-sugar epimerase
MQVALAWLLHRSPNILLIPGTSSVAHLRENLAAGQLTLSPQTLAELDGIAFVPILINMARQKGASAYIGEGLNRWPAVNRLDAARLFRLALEKGAARGCYHGVAEEGVAFRQIAEVIGRRLNVPVISKTPEEAVHHFGWFAHFAVIDVPASSKQTQQNLGWSPTQPGLIADLDRPIYFEVNFRAESPSKN